MGAIGAAALVSLPSAAARAQASPAAQLALASARGQLEDWVTCPSAKTPEGQAKIRSIGVKIDAIKTEMAVESRKASTRASAPDVYTADGRGVAQPGGRLDVFA